MRERTPPAFAASAETRAAAAAASDSSALRRPVDAPSPSVTPASTLPACALTRRDDRGPGAGEVVATGRDALLDPAAASPAGAVGRATIILAETVAGKGGIAGAEVGPGASLN